MPYYVVQRAQDILNDQGKAMRDARVLLLGVTYKPNIADQRESPALPVAKHLLAHGAHVEFHDPHVATWTSNGRTLHRVPDLEDALEEADLTILLQQHAEYDVEAIAKRAQFLFDTRGVAEAGEKVQRL